MKSHEMEGRNNEDRKRRGGGGMEDKPSKARNTKGGGEGGRVGGRGEQRGLTIF
jgi:hypothetical protein